jgi:hypothetical protein
MKVEFIAWTYAPSPKESKGFSTKVYTYEGFKKQFMKFYDHIKYLQDELNLSSVIETRTSDDSKKTLHEWRVRIADEIFCNELTQEVA